MAEGIQEPQYCTAMYRRYFCHHCARSVSPYQEDELCCPECSGGFLEEVSKELFEIENQPSYWEELYESGSDHSSLASGLDMETLIGNMLLNVTNMDESGARQDLEALPSPDSLSNILHRMVMPDLPRDLSSEFRQPPSFGDYFDADNELDAIASQLLDETEMAGPPPISKEQIKSLPTVTISREDVAKGVQCTVCMDDFSTREKAKILSCNHMYHEKCITPWLERQASCPNCRDRVEVPEPSKRSRSCPRSSRLNPRSLDSRRYSEATSLSDFFTTSLNPFRFLN